MTQFILGADLGGTKTHVLISNDQGIMIGFGEAGAANHEVVGYDGLFEAVNSAVREALKSASLSLDKISGAGFGVAGYDWPSERQDTLATLQRLGLQCPLDFMNDTSLGLLAGSKSGWGIGVVSGTGCNCRGWDKSRRKKGMVTGHGIEMGEGAGASELTFKAIQAVAYEWTKRGAHTALSDFFIHYVGAKDLGDLLEGLANNRYTIDAHAAPFIFDVAREGDVIAKELIRWAGNELAELVKSVIRQLDFQELEFDIVMIGSMFDGGSLLIEPMQDTILQLAPRAKFVRLNDPPVVGAIF